MSSAVGYLLFALVTIPLWWPALRALLAEVRAAADSEPLLPPSSPARSAPLPLVTPWSTTRTRLAALAAARQAGSARRWEGGFGRRSP